MSVHLIDAKLPDFGTPKARPELPRAIYLSRLDALNRARRRAAMDAVVIYADREHAANLQWLTGFEPRFEEALLVVASGQTPTLLAGPENLMRAMQATIEVQARLYPPFGLMGQDRSESPDLEEVLLNAGIASGHRVGVLGWKYFSPHEAARPDAWLETPAYLVDTLRKIVGTAGRVDNANAILMDAGQGLRAVNETEQIVQFEYGAVAASEAVKLLLARLAPGVSEVAAVQSMQLGALPFSCHPMLSSGPRIAPLESPTHRVIEMGDPLAVGIGYWGGFASRMGFVANDKADLPEAARDYVERIAIPYFAAIAAWYETVGIGVAGGDLDLTVRRHLEGSAFDLFLNPGYLTHLDGWVNTPIFPGSTLCFTSGQAVQCSVTVAPPPPHYGINAGDGVVLLDEKGRAELAEKFPVVMSRIAARRAFMSDILGIRLKPEVLPLSNLAAALPPFLLSSNRLLSKV